MHAVRALAVTIAVVLATAGCGAARAIVGPIEDGRLATDVRQELRRASADTGARVNVDVMDGTVYLTGRVDTEGQKSAAEAAVWRVAGVRQVVNDVQAGDAPAASALPLVTVRHPALEYLPGVARVEQTPSGPAAAFDANGRRVATVYSVPVRELTGRGLEELRAPHAIDHVSIYLASSHPDLPLPHYHVVLWHVSHSEASALR
jgi:hypothetical protein